MATEARRAPDGTLYLRSPYPLGPYAAKITERLDLWAERFVSATTLANVFDGSSVSQQMHD